MTNFDRERKRQSETEISYPQKLGLGGTVARKSVWISMLGSTDANAGQITCYLLEFTVTESRNQVQDMAIEYKHCNTMVKHPKCHLMY